jgi:hypothetical protein
VHAEIRSWYVRVRIGFVLRRLDPHLFFGSSEDSCISLEVSADSSNMLLELEGWAHILGEG